MKSSLYEVKNPHTIGQTETDLLWAQTPSSNSRKRNGKGQSGEALEMRNILLDNGGMGILFKKN